MADTDTLEVLSKYLQDEYVDLKKFMFFFLANNNLKGKINRGEKWYRPSKGMRIKDMLNKNKKSISNT